MMGYWQCALVCEGRSDEPLAEALQSLMLVCRPGDEITVEVYRPEKAKDRSVAAKLETIEPFSPGTAAQGRGSFWKFIQRASTCISGKQYYEVRPHEVKWSTRSTSTTSRETDHRHELCHGTADPLGPGSPRPGCPRRVRSGCGGVLGGAGLVGAGGVVVAGGAV